MKEIKEIVVDFDDKGNPHVHVENIFGPECVKATKFVEKGLGKVTADKKTKEYHEYLSPRRTLYC